MCRFHVGTLLMETQPVAGLGSVVDGHRIREQGTGYREGFSLGPIEVQRSACRCTNMSGVSEDLMRTQRCRTCRKASYCGTACQSAHRPAHKASCAEHSASLAAEAASAAGVAPQSTMDMTVGIILVVTRHEAESTGHGVVRYARDTRYVDFVLSQRM